MELINNKEHYTVTEISEILQVNTGMIYYRIRNREDFPESIMVKSVQHWSQDQLCEIDKCLKKTLKRGISRQEKYVPLQNNSYSRLKLENLAQVKEIERLNKELKRWEV